MKFSKYTFVYQLNKDYYALYHSLLVKTVFLNTSEYNKVTNKIKNEEKDDEIMKYLIDNFFVILSDKEDITIKDYCTSLLPHQNLANVYIIVTENCNFQCKYCFVSEAVKKHSPIKQMTEEVAIKTIEKLSAIYEKEGDQNERLITFYGGEPLMNFPIIKFFIEEVEKFKQKYYWPPKIQYSVITNGSLLSEEIISFFKQHNVGIAISYDVSKEAHSNRISKSGLNTFSTVNEKIKLCKEYKFPFALSVTITEEMLASQEETINKLVEIHPEGGVGYGMLIPNKHYEPQNSYYERATDFIIKSYKVFRKVGINEDRMNRKIDSFCKQKLYFFDCCASGGSQLVVSPTGSTGICHGYLNTGKFFSSNICDETFSFLNNPTFEPWINRTPLLMEKCQDCEALGICGGGCPYAADYMYGSINELDTRFCTHAKKMLQWMINDLYEHTIK